MFRNYIYKICDVNFVYTYICAYMLRCSRVHVRSESKEDEGYGETGERVCG